MNEWILRQSWETHSRNHEDASSLFEGRAFWGLLAASSRHHHRRRCRVSPAYRFPRIVHTSWLRISLIRSFPSASACLCVRVRRSPTSLCRLSCHFAFCIPRFSRILLSFLRITFSPHFSRFLVYRLFLLNFSNDSATSPMFWLFDCDRMCFVQVCEIIEQDCLEVKILREKGTEKFLNDNNYLREK